MSVIAIDWSPGSRKLRMFAFIWLVIFGAAAVVGHRPPWFWALAVIVPLIGIPAPRAIKYVYVGWMAAAYPLGWVISHVLLAVTYFGLFAIVGVVSRLAGRDVLGLTFDREALTYWVRRGPAPDVRRYFKQF